MLIFCRQVKRDFLYKINLILFSFLISFQIISSTPSNVELVRNNFNFSNNHEIKNLANLSYMKGMKVLAIDYHLYYFYNNNFYPSKLIHTPAWIRKTTDKRLMPLYNIQYFSHSSSDAVLDAKYDYILCSSRICEEGRANLKNKKIKSMLNNYKKYKYIKNYSKWEHTKHSDLILYKNLKKSE